MWFLCTKFVVVWLIINDAAVSNHYSGPEGHLLVDGRVIDGWWLDISITHAPVSLSTVTIDGLWLDIPTTYVPVSPSTLMIESWWLDILNHTCTIEHACSNDWWLEIPNHWCSVSMRTRMIDDWWLDIPITHHRAACALKCSTVDGYTLEMSNHQPLIVWVCIFAAAWVIVNVQPSTVDCSSVHAARWWVIGMSNLPSTIDCWSAHAHRYGASVIGRVQPSTVYRPSIIRVLDGECLECATINHGS